MRLVLASGSPRRQDLLGRLGFPFETHPSSYPERDPRPGEDPAGYALEMAGAKAAEVAARHSDSVALAADTVVSVGASILGKPADEREALRMLQLLRGQRHTVLTAVVVRCGDVHSGVVSAQVEMSRFSEEAAVRYVASGEPMDKAGAYAVQGLGRSLVTRVTGCFETVVGLPLCLTTELLASCGLAFEAGSDGYCTHLP